MTQVPSSTIIPYVDETSALLILELRPEDLQDSILTAIGDTLTSLLEEELAAELATESNMVESVVVVDQTKSTDAQDRFFNAAPTNPEVYARTLFALFVILS